MMPSDGRRDRHDVGPPHAAVPVVAGDHDQPASARLGKDLLGIASNLLLRQHIDGLHAGAQCGVRSFNLDGVAAAQIPHIVENATTLVAYGVPDQYRRSSRFARRGAVAPPSDDAGVSWWVEYPVLVGLDGHDRGVPPGSGG